MSDYHGNERRVGNCDTHQQNTVTINQAATDIAAIKSSMTTARWIIGLLIGTGAMIIGSTLEDIKNTMSELRQDVKLVLPAAVRIERLEALTERHENKISELEKSTREHHTH